MCSNGSMVAATSTGVREVHVGNLPDGGHFRISNLATVRNRVTVVGWTYGTKLFSNDCRARVRLCEGSRHVIFGEGSTRREFDSKGSAEVNYPTMVDVVPVSDEEFNEASNPPSNWRHHTGEDDMSTQTAVDEKVVKAHQAKYAFQMKALEQAKADGDDAKIQTAQNRLDAIKEAAEAAGVDLQAATGTKAAATPKADNPGGKGKAAAAKPESKGEKLKAANKARLDGLAAKKAAAPKPPAKPKKDKAADATRDCLCGCGGETAGKFRPGHDARVKGLLYKVERGEMKFDQLPETVKPWVKFAGKAASAGKDTSDYRVVKSPVKIPGRTDVEVIDSL